jgi:hypothetical protein
MPSIDVRTSLMPTATNWVPDLATLFRWLGAPDVREVHVMPSGDVRTMPFEPTATNWVPDQTTPNRTVPLESPDVREVHVIPSGEV